MFCSWRDGRNEFRRSHFQGTPRYHRVGISDFMVACESADMNNNLDNELQVAAAGNAAARALSAPTLQSAEYPAPLTSIHKVIKKLNRDTTLVATGLLGTVIFAALVLAFLGRDPKADELPKEASGILLNANPATLGSNGKSLGELAWGQATSVVHEFGTKVSNPDVQANATSRSPSPRPDSAKVVRSKIPKVRCRSSGRTEDVKARLIALWHQSLKRRKNPRGWTLFSNSNQWRKNKISIH